MINESEIARKAILEVLDNQLAAGNPPETRETLDRLLAEGHPDAEARKYIACVIASEIFGVIREGREYDHSRYVDALHALPKLPWDS